MAQKPFPAANQPQNPEDSTTSSSGGASGALITPPAALEPPPAPARGSGVGTDGFGINCSGQLIKALMALALGVALAMAGVG